jgi:hypothetical protein
MRANVPQNAGSANFPTILQQSSRTCSCQNQDSSGAIYQYYIKMVTMASFSLSAKLQEQLFLQLQLQLLPS